MLYINTYVCCVNIMNGMCVKNLFCVRNMHFTPTSGFSWEFLQASITQNATVYYGPKRENRFTLFCNKPTQLQIVCTVFKMSRRISEQNICLTKTPKENVSSVKIYI